MSPYIEISQGVMANKKLTVNDQNETFPKSVDFFDERYYCINKQLLSFIGQWPYQCIRQKNIRILLIAVISVTIMVPQTRGLIMAWGKLDEFAACFPPMMAHVGCDVLLLNCIIHAKEMRDLLDETRKDWERLRHLPQGKILHEHGERGRMFTIVYCSVCYGVICTMLTTPLLPKFLNILVPLNHTRENIYIFPTDYMVDPDKYFYPIFVHLSVGTVLVLSILVTVDTIYMCLAQHVCAMFEILRYDLENILPKDEISVILEPDYHEDIFYQKIVSCIKRHKVLIKYIKVIESTCEWTLLFVVGISVVALSFTGYQTVSKSTPRADVVRMAMFSIAQTFHLYCITLPGHWISDSSSFFPDSAYACKWYLMSLKARKLIVLLIRASIEPCTIVAGKIYVMSIENFGSVLQTSVSYLIVLTTFQ